MKANMCPECLIRKVYYQRKKKLWKCWRCNKEYDKPHVDLNYQVKKRRVHEETIMTKEALTEVINNIPHDETRAIVAFLYLTGWRISEALSIKKQQVEMKDNGTIIINEVKVLKRRPNEQTGEFPKRTVVITKNEMAYWWIVKDYMGNRPNDRPIFAFANIEEDIVRKKVLPDNPRKRAWYLIHKYTNYFPHYWRHLRVTHLFKYTGMRDTQIQHYMGWSSPAMLSVYGHFSTKDIEEELTKSEL